MATVGFNVEQIQYKNLRFSMWDLGGQTNIRPFWRCYIGNTAAIIYVVDSADRERIGLAKHELWSILQEEEMVNTHLLVFANKKDQPDAMSEIEVAMELELRRIKDRRWFICRSNALNGEGLTTGLDWLASAVLGYDTPILDLGVESPKVDDISSSSSVFVQTSVEGAAAGTSVPGDVVESPQHPLHQVSQPADVEVDTTAEVQTDQSSSAPPSPPIATVQTSTLPNSVAVNLSAHDTQHTTIDTAASNT
uniref:ADP-ribosylation factor-like protein 1 n=2 Tax=Lygus hesperus TaxID=30085 RepID=A0A0A9ZH93_LYGHE